MTDLFKNMARPVTSPALGSMAITPSDSTDLVARIRAVTLNVGGTLAWVNEEDVTQATGPLPAGTYPLMARRILATGTTATGLTGWV